MAPRKVGGALAQVLAFVRRQQRTQPRPHPRDVVGTKVRGRPFVHGVEQVRDVLGRAVGLVEVAVVRGIGRTDVRIGRFFERNDEDTSTITWHGEHSRHVNGETDAGD